RTWSCWLWTPRRPLGRTGSSTAHGWRRKRTPPCGNCCGRTWSTWTPFSPPLPPPGSLSSSSGWTKSAADESGLRQTEKALSGHGLSLRLAEETDIKRLLSVYYRQELPTEVPEDVDGERAVTAHG